MPAADVLDAGHEYVVVLDLPGAQQEHLEVKPGPMPGTVSVRAEARVPVKGQVLRGERMAPASGTVRYTRVVPVGWDADASKARATLAHGVLTLTVPRQERPEERRS